MDHSRIYVLIEIDEIGLLIFLDENYEMQINGEKEQELIHASLSGGLNAFKSFLGRRIHLPQDERQWPNPNMIVEANRFRGI